MDILCNCVQTLLNLGGQMPKFCSIVEKADRYILFEMQGLLHKKLSGIMCELKQYWVWS